MKVAVLSANLGGFDVDIPHVEQKLPEGVEVTYHQWNDKNFPPIAGLTPRLQYRIPKMFGWEMLPNYDYYLWMDGSMHLGRPDAVAWFIEKAKDVEFVVFKHPHRHSIDEEVRYIEWKLDIRNMYIARRYKNGLHREQLNIIKDDPGYVDDKLYASTVFMYQNSWRVREMLKKWWYYQSRYYTCDQVALPYVLWKHEVSTYCIDMHVFRNEYVQPGRRHAS